MTPDNLLKDFTNGRSYFGRNYLNLIIYNGVNNASEHIGYVQF